MKSSEDLMYTSPLYDDAYKLQVALGGLDFRDATIKNLRSQIKNLREMLVAEGCLAENIDNQQYKHLRK